MLLAKQGDVGFWVPPASWNQPTVIVTGATHGPAGTSFVQLDDRDNVPYLTNECKVVPGQCFYPKHAAAASAEVIVDLGGDVAEEEEGDVAGTLPGSSEDNPAECILPGGEVASQSKDAALPQEVPPPPAPHPISPARARLILEAGTLEHLLTHTPKLPLGICAGCDAKQTERHHRRRKLRDAVEATHVPTRWAQELTSDPVFSLNDADVHGNRCSILVNDRHMDYTDAIPKPGKGH